MNPTFCEIVILRYSIFAEYLVAIWRNLVLFWFDFWSGIFKLGYL